MSFVAKGPASELVSEVVDDVFLYKLAILYGSNASGKSNMLIAMNEVFRLLVMPKSNASKKIEGYIPFVLTSDTQDSIRENTLNNHSVLSVCNKAAFKEDIEPFNVLSNWIMTNCHDVDADGDKEKGIVEILNEAYTDVKKRKFFNQMLCKADLNILEYKPTVEDRTISQEFRDRIKQEDIPDKMKEALLKSTVESITFLNHSENGNFEIPLKLLSKGTMKYVRILNTLYDMVTSSHVYYLDELGEDLHYDLLFYYLNVFLFNSDKSQLIITSQETALLSQDLINDNRGVVWFVEKNKETASSEYSRGDSFGLHKNLSLYNSYRIGRLGAKPELGSIFIDMEN